MQDILTPNTKGMFGYLESNNRNGNEKHGIEMKILLLLLCLVCKNSKLGVKLYFIFLS